MLALVVYKLRSYSARLSVHIASNDGRHLWQMSKVANVHYACISVGLCMAKVSNKCIVLKCKLNCLALGINVGGLGLGWSSTP